MESNTKIKKETRSYSLINKTVDVNLTNYTDLITDIINKHAPEVNVTVLQNQYLVSPRLTQSQAIRIGREIAKTELGQFCYLKPVLFKSKDYSP